MLGDNLRFAGRSDEALARAGAGRPRCNPSSPSPGSPAAEVLLKEGRNAEAAAAYEHVLSVAPDHIEALRGLGDLALLRGDTDGRRRALRAASWSIDPADAGAMVKLGVIRMRGGARDEAITLFRQAVETRAEERRGAALSRGSSRLERPRTRRRVPVFERALAAGPRRRPWP